MIRAFCLSITMIAVVVTSAAETPTHKVEGIIVDRDGAAVDNASIAVDGRVVMTTGSDGRFVLELRRGARELVITNPTQYAVALRYERAELAPRVVAKGSGAVAARIRTEARRNGVPVLERKPLARALFRTVKVGRFVPSELYEAVVVVLAIAYRRRRRVA